MENPGQSPSGVSLPSPAAQSYIHELAKTLPVPRKQNSACDACRSRKVKCNKADGDEKCQHCLSKNYPCTNYVQQATAEKKRTTGVQRRPRGISMSHASPASAPYPRPYTQVEGRVSDLASSSFPDRNSPSSASPGPQPIFPSFQDGLEGPPITQYTPTVHLLAYLFAPPIPASHLPQVPAAQLRSVMYADWGDHASKLDDPVYRAEFALDLVEVFFQIVHTRWPLLNPEDFRARLRLPPPGHATHPLAQSTPSSNHGSSTNGYPSPAPSSPPSTGSAPLHPAIVAAVLAWGAKFSEHSLLVADRLKNGGQGWLPKVLIDRARDVAEALKVHRIPSPDHVLIGLLLEPLQNQNPDVDTGYQGFWLAASIRHLVALQYNHKSVVANIQDSEARGIMIFAWWMATLCDGYSSAYYRRKPLLDDEDYDIDFYTADPLADVSNDPHAAAPSTREQLEFLGYYRANHALARIARSMSRSLWRPASEAEGIPYAILCSVVSQIYEWRDQYLHQVGVPPNSAANWDFISAISACASDATYHVMWIILFNAVDDFGIREINDLVRNGHPAEMFPDYRLVQASKQKLMDEALHGALRISGLAGVLASNGYLRLDPAVMHISCIQAGTLLARLGRPEVSNCIAALQQYGYAYEEAAEQGGEIERVFAAARGGESDMNHMSSTIARSVSPEASRG